MKYLSRRERQIMDVLFQKGRVSSAEIHAALPDPPSYSAVRCCPARARRKRSHPPRTRRPFATARTPSVARDQARRSAPHQHLVQTFFEGSVEQTVAALLDESATKLDQQELARLRALIDQAKGTAKAGERKV